MEGSYVDIKINVFLTNNSFHYQCQLIAYCLSRMSTNNLVVLFIMLISKSHRYKSVSKE